MTIKETYWNEVEKLASKRTQTEACCPCEYSKQCKKYRAGICWHAEEIVKIIKGGKHEI